MKKDQVIIDRDKLEDLEDELKMYTDMIKYDTEDSRFMVIDEFYDYNSGYSRTSKRLIGKKESMEHMLESAKAEVEAKYNIDKADIEREVRKEIEAEMEALKKENKQLMSSWHYKLFNRNK